MTEMRYKVWDNQLKVWRPDVIVDQDGRLFVKYESDHLSPLWSEAAEAMVVCRSLGIYDDTGEEIYESYIVSICSMAALYKNKPPPLKVVLYNPKQAIFTIRPHGPDTRYHIHGNIFENPELLERRPE